MNSSPLNKLKSKSVIENKPELFGLLLEDEKKQDAIWKVSRYWTYYMDMVSAAILKKGITAFRRDDKIASSFCSTRPSLFIRKNASELNEFNQEISTHAGKDSKISLLFPIGFKKFMAKYVLDWPLIRKAFDWFRVSNLYVLSDRYFFTALSYFYAMSQDYKEVQCVLDAVDDSGLGEPTDLIQHGESRIGQNALRAVQHLSLVKSYMGEEPKRILEIGGGFGSLCEVAFKAMAYMQTYVLLDLPQTCYITTQYLKSVFPGEVLDYEDLKHIEMITSEVLGQKRIAVLPSWMLPRIQMQFDCFVNTASFQEMEISIVKHYMQYVAPLCSHAYLWNFEKGHGQGFNDEKVTFDALAQVMAAERLMLQDRDPTHGASRNLKLFHPMSTHGFFSKQ